jgi:TrpR family trp operon transcriptional repressor
MKLDNIDEIALVLSNENNPIKIEAFIKSILTEKEVSDISNRWEFVRLLDNGMTQRAISKKLRLSLCKITRGSKELKKENSVFKEMLDKYYKLTK